jgi:2'-5' RNA ligase
VRLFVALEIPSAVRENFAALMKDLRAIAPRAKWVRAENLHITLKFIGETAPTKLEVIRAALAAVSSGQPVALEFRGIGFFAKRYLFVLSAVLEESSGLQSLATDIDRRLQPLGIPGEERVYTPHVTLARSNDLDLLTKLRPFIDANSKRSFGSFEVREFQLIESKLKSSGAEYTTLQSFAFAAEASGA